MGGGGRGGILYFLIRMDFLKVSCNRSTIMHTTSSCLGSGSDLDSDSKYYYPGKTALLQ